jgi:antitoxin component YwqK of YwqJK toxin-antitoxin module
MKKTIILFFLSIINIGLSTAQVELKGKKLQERLEQINSDIIAGNYEHAIKLVNNQDTIITEKNVKKKELPSYLKNDSIIKTKIVVFDENKTKVLTLKYAYEAKKYNEAIELLDVQLSNENSYLETQNIQNQLKENLTVLKSEYANFKLINSIVDKLNFTQIEPTQLDIFLNSLKSATNTSDNGVNTIVANLPAMKDISEKVKENNGNKFITKINQFVSEPIFNDLDYAKASKLIARVKVLNSYSDKLYATLGNNVSLTKQSDAFKQVLIDKVTSLQKYKEANRPTIIEAIEYIDHALDTVATESVVETRIKIDTTLLRKGLAGDIEVFYYLHKNPNGLFVNHKGLSCILEDNDSIPFNGIVKEYDEYGSQVVAEHNFVYGRKEGKYSAYYNGELTSEVNYMNGKKEGKYKCYEKGKLYSEVNYVNGKLEGQEYVYIQEKKLPGYNYVNDKPEGKCISYYNGELNYIHNYVNGKLQGKRIDYFEGHIWAIFNYVNDKKEGKYEHFFEDGKIAEVCYYKNDKKEGKELKYWKDGTFRGETNWVNGKKEGYEIDRKGDVEETSCYYLHGKLHGERMRYNDDGNKIVFTFVNDQMDGFMKLYYPNGNIHYKVMIKTINGVSKEVGRTTFYNKYQNGKVDRYVDAE